MIFDKILDVLFCFPFLLLDSLPDISISIPGEVSNAINGFQTFANNLAYVFPLKGLVPIIVISFSIKSFQILWALIIRVKSFIPTMGS